MSKGLFAALPKPLYTGEHEEIPAHAQSKGPRIVVPGEINESQIVLRVCQAAYIQERLTDLIQRAGPPPYGRRSGWRPRNIEDFGDGGAFPEIPVAQYPLDMGRKGTTGTSNALALTVDGQGKVKYDTIARRGHNDDRIIHSSFKDLIPLRQQANAGDLNLDRPDQETVEESAARTKAALEKIITGTLAAQKPKNVKGRDRTEPTYVRYTPANQMGDTSKKNDRILKIVNKQQDPMEPPKFKHKKIPRGPPSPPPPVMHSPPRKLTAEDQEMWKIPPSVSNWKNSKGYTVPLDVRMAADGRGLRDVTINDKFAQFSEALFTADRISREEVNLRNQMKQKLAEKENLAKEEHLREMARKAREERMKATSSTSKPRRRSRSNSYSDASSRSRSYSRSPSPASDDSAARERIKARQERAKENERQLRQSRMGTEKKIQMMAREQNRDISERVALGLAKPTENKETMYDSRLFNQNSGFDAGFNEDNPYDKPLFAAQDAISSIYNPKASGGDDFDDDEGGDAAADKAMDRITKGNRFEALGKVKEGQGFKGAEMSKREEGPVMFEKDKDEFGIDGLIGEVKSQIRDERQKGHDDDERGGSRRKRYGLDDGRRSEDEERRKRARVDDDD